MVSEQQIAFGYGKEVATMQLNKLNRHGIIAGATGTGKTITLKVLAEQLSEQGVPVFLSDIKGDLASLAQANLATDVTERLQKTHNEHYEPQKYPVEIWDALSKEGTPIRLTVSEIGPVLLTRLLGLNDVQEGILNIVFRVADEQQLLLIDLMDLRAMLNYVGEHAKELSTYYGNISAKSIGAILRSLVVLEQQGGDVFFGEPSLDINDLLRVDDDGRGVINILNAKTLYQLPTLYAAVLLAVLSQLFETLPEVGDLEKPKLVFFFDEAHALFNDVPKVLLDKIELIVRLIRSKGVGVFFVTQNPTDILDKVASQLGNRIQHGLRAFTPKELKVVKAVADTFRQENDMNLEDVIRQLQVGEAVVSTLQADGTPSFADRVLIYPPQSHIGTIDPSVLASVLNHSYFAEKYDTPINRESAHEQLQAMIEQTTPVVKQETPIEDHPAIPQHEEKSLLDQLGEQLLGGGNKRSRKTDSNFDRFTKNMMSSVGREVGRAITRGITGMWKK